jgi:hypothetical protein
MKKKSSDSQRKAVRFVRLEAENIDKLFTVRDVVMNIIADLKTLKE